MPSQPLDPAPRVYAPAVTLLRRSDRGRTVAPETCTIKDITDWLVSGALVEADLLALVEALCWRLVAAGFGVDRVNVSIGTLHPQLVGVSIGWNTVDGLCDEVVIDRATLLTSNYLDNPLALVIEGGETVRARSDDPVARARFTMLTELAEQGYVDYLAMPLHTGGRYHNAITLATRREAGFPEPEIATLSGVWKLLAMHVEQHILRRISVNVLDTYIGGAAGARVLDGSIRRGTGSRIEAVIWMSDMRGFTDLVDRLDGPSTIEVLNAYFERQVAAVVAHGGEILKFTGDGILAVFPIDTNAGAVDAAQRALTAARSAAAATAALSNDVTALSHIDGWRPLRTGIALHLGEAFFGNVGGPQRLDFTVIGKAVNVTSRLEGLTKTLHRAIVVSEPVARLVNDRLVDLGEHALRGLAEPIRVFSPAEAEAISPA